MIIRKKIINVTYGPLLFCPSAVISSVSFIQHISLRPFFFMLGTNQIGIYFPCLFFITEGIRRRNPYMCEELIVNLNMEKETIELVKKMIEEGNLSQEIAEKYCPELKESEDERIRKWCINLIKATCDYDSPTSRKEVDDAIAWLEKQGEQKSLDDTAKEVTKDKDAAVSFLKSTGIMNENGELADEYKIEQGEQKPADWSEEDENELAILRGYIKSGEWSTAHISRALGIIDSITNKMTEK